MTNNDYIPLRGYELHYGINKKGEMISYARKSHKKDRVLRTDNFKNGYRFVVLLKDGVYKNHYVHRLLAMMFLGEWNESLQVNHKDGNKLNNELCNLEMVTILENNKHALKSGLINNRGDRCGTSKLIYADAEFIREIYNSGFCFQKEIAAYFKVGKLAINRIINNHSFKIESYEHE